MRSCWSIWTNLLTDDFRIITSNLTSPISTLAKNANHADSRMPTTNLEREKRGVGEEEKKKEKKEKEEEWDRIERKKKKKEWEREKLCFIEKEREA